MTGSEGIFEEILNEFSGGESASGGILNVTSKLLLSELHTIVVLAELQVTE